MAKNKTTPTRKKLKRKIDKIFNIEDSNTIHPYRLAYLTKPKNDSLAAQWCVTYSIWSFQENKLVRKRVIIAGKSVNERLMIAQETISELNSVLQSGKAYLGHKPKEFETTYTAPKTRIEGSDTSIHKAVSDYLTFCKRVHSKNTFRVYRTALMNLLSYLERHQRPNDKISDFSSADASQFLKELITITGIGNRSRNNRKGYVSTFFNYWIGLDQSKKLLKKGNPFEDKSIKMLPQVSNKHQAYSEKQQQEYKDACEKLDMSYLLTFNRWLYYTLMRPHEELRLLRVRDVRANTIYITGQSSKTNDGQHVNIPLPLEELIQQQRIREYPGHYYVFSPTGEPGPVSVGPKFFYRRHQRIVTYLDLKGSGHDMYSWKHTGAIALWNATKDIELIRQQARHTDIKQTIEYLRDLGLQLADDSKIHKFPRF